MNRGKIHSNSSNDWQTPASVFDPLHTMFAFTVDLAAGCVQHSRCSHYVDDLLNVDPYDFKDERCWINPPYGSFLYEGLDMVAQIAEHADVVVALLPMSPDLQWYHRNVLGVADQYVRRGRIKFVPTPQMVTTAYKGWAATQQRPERACWRFKNSPAHANLLAVYGDDNDARTSLPGEPTSWIRI